MKQSANNIKYYSEEIHGRQAIWSVKSVDII